MVESVAANTVNSQNPRTGDAVGQFELTEASVMPAIIEVARLSFSGWSGLTLRERTNYLRRAYQEFFASRDELAQLISAETGKPICEAYSSEVLPVLDCFKYYIKNSKKLLKTETVRAVNPLLKLRKGYVRYEPLGVIAVISPWNFPFLLSMQHIIPALLSGNVVVQKPSEFTSLVSLKVLEIFQKANFPEGVLTVVTGFAEVGQALVAANVDKIFFTGSTAVGKKIYQTAASTLTPVNMELGGNDPMIVLDDADIERASNAALWGAFGNAGQACVSVERLLVHQSIFDRFVDRFVSKARELKFETSKRDGQDVSCLINEAHFRKIEGLVQDAKALGVTVHLGGKSRPDVGELYYEPTILSNSDATMRISSQEIFGPVVLLQPFSSDNEAVLLANDSEFGLSASVWSRNRDRAIAIAESVKSGSVLINEVQSHIAQFEAPYTGIKQSGIGVSHGPWGMLEMVQPKYISFDRPAAQVFLAIFARHLRRSDVWWFPYNKERIADFQAFSAFLHAASWFVRLKAIPGTLKAIMRRHPD